MSMEYGAPRYYVNTATLGLFVEYPLFKGFCNGVEIKPILRFQPFDRRRGPFGGWELNYHAAVIVDTAARCIRLQKCGGQIVSFPMPDVPAPEQGRTLTAPNGDTLTEHPKGFVYTDGDLHYCFSAFAGRNPLLKLCNGYGCSLYFTYEGPLLAQIADDAGRSICFAYDPAGFCRSMALPDGRECRFSYENGFLACIENFLGAPTRFAYDAQGLLREIVTGFKPRATRFTYDPSADGAPRLRSVQNPNGGLTQYAVPMPNRVRVTTPAGRVRFYESQGGKTVSIRDGAGEMRSVYENGKRVLQVDRNGAKIAAAYDAKGRLVRLTDPEGGVRAYRYGDNTVETINELGLVTRRVYNDAGDVLQTIFPDGRAAFWEYDELGRLVQETMPNGRIIRMQHDRFGNVVAMADNEGFLAALRYDEFGYECVARAEREGAETQFERDALGRVTKAVLPDGRQESCRYSCCALSEYTDAAGNRTLMERDGLLKVYNQIDPTGFMRGSRFDADGIPVETFDPMGSIRKYQFNKAGFCTQSTDALAALERSAYAPEGQLIEAVDALGGTTRFSYSPAGLLQSVTDPAGNTLSHSYDAAGRKTQSVTPVGRRTCYAYDGADELIQKESGAQSLTLLRDAAENITSAQNENGEWRYTYDTRSRVTGMTAPDGTAFAYAYDTGDALRALTCPGGDKVSYTYDLCGRISGVRWGEHSLRRSFDAAGNITSEEFDNGVSARYAYDPCGRMTELYIAGKETLYEAAWVYDARGRVRSETLCIPSLADLPKAEETDLAAAFTPGNRVCELNGAPCQTDADGNVTELCGARYAYDESGRLCRWEKNGDAVAYGYDPMDKPFKVIRVQGDTTRYYDAHGLLLLERENGHERRYIYAGAQLIAGVIDGEAVFYHHDRMGNIVLVTNAAAEAVCAYQYHPYGKLKRRMDSFCNPFTFMGALGVTEEGDGLYLTGLRPYDADAGRFLQPDPAGFADGRNLYRYANCDPVTCCDPDGAFALTGAAVLAFLAGAYTVYKVGKAVKNVHTIGSEGKKLLDERDKTFETGNRLNTNHRSNLNKNGMLDPDKWVDNYYQHREQSAKMLRQFGDSGGKIFKAGAELAQDAVTAGAGRCMKGATDRLKAFTPTSTPSKPSPDVYDITSRPGGRTWKGYSRPDSSRKTHVDWDGTHD